MRQKNILNSICLITNTSYLTSVCQKEKQYKCVFVNEMMVLFTIQFTEPLYELLLMCLYVYMCVLPYLTYCVPIYLYCICFVIKLIKVLCVIYVDLVVADEITHTKNCCCISVS